MCDVCAFEYFVFCFDAWEGSHIEDVLWPLIYHKHIGKCYISILVFESPSNVFPYQCSMWCVEYKLHHLIYARVYIYIYIH